MSQPELSFWCFRFGHEKREAIWRNMKRQETEMFEVGTNREHLGDPPKSFQNFPWQQNSVESQRSQRPRSCRRHSYLSPSTFNMSPVYLKDFNAEASANHHETMSYHNGLPQLCALVDEGALAKVISEKTKLDVEKNGRCRSWQSSNELHRIPRKNPPVPSLGCRWRARAAPLAKARHSRPMQSSTHFIYVRSIYNYIRSFIIMIILILILIILILIILILSLIIHLWCWFTRVLAIMTDNHLMIHCHLPSPSNSLINLP